MGQESLLSAIVTRLRQDTSGASSLVTLTGHSSSKEDGLRIGRDKPPVKGRLPYLGVKVFTSTPLISTGDVPSLQVARVHFICYAAEELLAIKLADRLEVLLNSDNSSPNRAYLDFSGASVRNAMTRFKSRSEYDFNESTDTYSQLVEADVIWDVNACPVS